MRHLVILLLLLIAVAGCGDDGAVGYDAWRPLLAAEIAGAGVDRPADLYKFLHQSVMGPAHAVPDAAHARGWLDREWSELPPATAPDRPPLLTLLRPDGRLVRVDLTRLRDLMVGAGPAVESAALDTLAAAFAGTGQSWTREPELLASLWSAVEADPALWRGCFTAEDLAAFDVARDGAWPAVHHSESYRTRRAPHYRVVDPRLLPSAWRDHGGTP